VGFLAAQPWLAICAPPGLPRNAVSGRPYSGINVLILWGAVIEGGYPSQDWLTFRQAMAAGGCVRKGEQGVTVCYADRFTSEAEKQRSAEQDDDARSIPFLKRFVVFNVAQCDGLPERFWQPMVGLDIAKRRRRAAIADLRAFASFLR
jgi:antirestriction protein ArdC